MLLTINAPFSYRWLARHCGISDADVEHIDAATDTASALLLIIGVKLILKICDLQNMSK